MSKTKFKILMVQPCYENFGGFFRTFAMARSLARLNNKITMLISSKESTCFSKKSISEKNLAQIELPRGVLGLNGRFIRGILACWHILFNKYDFIICFGVTQPESNIPLVFARLIGKRVILDRDEFWQANFTTRPWIAQKYVWFCEEILIKLFKNHLVASTLLFQHSKKSGAKNIEKVINGIDLEQFKLWEKDKARSKLGFAKEDKILLTFGNTYENERANLLFKTFEQVLRQDSSVKLIINRKPSEYLDRIGVDPKILNNITTTGFIEPKNLGIYLAAADLVLFLTGNTENEKACFPIRVGSYLNGEAVITTLKTDTEWCKILKEHDCALLSDNIFDLAKLICIFLNDKKRIESLKANVRVIKKQLNWNVLILTVMRLIDNYK